MGTAEAPLFDTGGRVQVGPPGAKFDLMVGSRATPCIVDWNEDGFYDLLVGALDGKLRLYYNEGGGLPPDLRHTLFVADAYGDLVVPYGYSSPTMADFDGDGVKDLIVGNAEGELYFYRNMGSQAAPAFIAGSRCESLSQPIDLGVQGRARPFACDWDGDGRQDLLSGSSQGKVHLFIGLPNAVAAPPLAAAGLTLEAPWPNPASPVSSLAFTLVREAAVDLGVFDLRGRRLATLLAETRGAGRHVIRWQGLDDDGRVLASGVYLLKLQADGEQASAKLLLRR